MRFLISFMAAIALAITALAFAGHSAEATARVSSLAQQEEQPGDGARRISPADARAAYDHGRAVIVDVRSLDSYKAEHVKCALSIPLDEIESRLSELPHNKMIITYCT